MKIRFILILLFVSTFCYAQSQKTYKIALSIHQDKTGRILIGELSSLSVLYPKEVQTINYNAKKKQINRFFESANGTWVSTLDGLHLLKGNKITKSLFRGINILHSIEDSKGNLWVGTSNGLYKNSKLLTEFESLVITYLHEDSKGNLWVGTSNGLYKNFQKTTDLYVNHISEDSKGNLWVGANSGLYKNLQIINKEPTYYIFHDDKQRLWVGTDNCLYINHKAIKRGIFVTEIIQTSQKSVFVSSNIGVLVYNNPKPKVSQQRVYGVNSFLETNQGITLFTKGGIVNGDTIINEPVRNPFFDPLDSSIIYSSDRGGTFKKGQKIWSKRAFCSQKINNGVLLGSSQGVYKYDGKSFKFYDSLKYTYSILINKKDTILAGSNGVKVNGNLIRDKGKMWDIHKGGLKNNIWLGGDNGLFVLDFGKLKDTPIKYPVYTIESYNDLLFCSTDKGVIVYNPKNGDTKTLYPNIGFWFGASHKDQTNKIWFGASNGVISFHPDSLKHSQNDNVILLNSDRGEVIKIVEGQPLNIKYTSLDYTNTTLSYVYKLEGKDQDWTHTQSNTVTYDNLDIGHYTFIVKSGLSKTTKVKVIIEPSFYRTNSAVLTYIIMGLSFVLFGSIAWEKYHKLLLDVKASKETLRNTDIKKEEAIKDAVSKTLKSEELKRLQEISTLENEVVQKNNTLKKINKLVDEALTTGKKGMLHDVIYLIEEEEKEYNSKPLTELALKVKKIHPDMPDHYLKILELINKNKSKQYISSTLDIKESSLGVYKSNIMKQFREKDPNIKDIKEYLSKLV